MVKVNFYRIYIKEWRNGHYPVSGLLTIGEAKRMAEQLKLKGYTKIKIKKIKLQRNDKHEHYLAGHVEGTTKHPLQ